MTPLVSVMIPCFNAAGTLPMALASLLAQDYQDWECIVVDDGSIDNPGALVEKAGDARIRLVRFEENRGRGAARQAALEAAGGKYLAMLDADDWCYPAKLRLQVEVMESEPDLALVSGGMAVTDERGELAGVRCTGTSRAPLGPFRKLGMPPVAHAPSMIRMAVAKQHKYDPAFKLAQDVDYLLRVMLDRRYAVLPEALYVYAEYGSVSPRKVLSAGRYLTEMFRKHAARFPLASRLSALKVRAKAAAYRVLFGLGCGRAVIARRSRRPTPAESDEYARARRKVLAVRQAVFGT